MILTLKFKSVSGPFSKTEFPTFSFSAVSPIAPLGPFMIKGYREESFHIMVTLFISLLGLLEDDSFRSNSLTG